MSDSERCTLTVPGMIDAGPVPYDWPLSTIMKQYTFWKELGDRRGTVQAKSPQKAAKQVVTGTSVSLCGKLRSDTWVYLDEGTKTTIKIREVKA